MKRTFNLLSLVLSFALIATVLPVHPVLSVSAARAAALNNWTALGAALNGQIMDIAVSNAGDAYAVGSFSNAGGYAAADFVAKWNGTSWSPLGTTALNGSIQAIAISDTDEIYVGGIFTNAGGDPNADYIAKWNGTSWSALGTTPLTQEVYSIAIHGNDVYAGGFFTNAGGDSNADYIARWNGTSWSALGTTPLAGPVNVFSIVVNGTGDVYAGGSFTNAGGDPNADYIAKWNGTSWSALGTVPLNSSVWAIAVSNAGNVYAGGDFTNAGGDLNADRIAKWNGTAWSALGTTPTTPSYYLYGRAIATRGAEVYVGFATGGGSEPAMFIAKWDGTTWSDPAATQLTYTVFAIAIQGTKLYAGGSFTNAGGNPNADYIAQLELPALDTTAPTVNTFTVPLTISSFDVPVASFTASDDAAVTGYLVTESPTMPSANAVGWSATTPGSYKVETEGSHTLYPWAKDAAGNVSAVFGSPPSVVVNIPRLYYVDDAANGNDNGTSWIDAYTDLQSALAAASDGDEIWVAAGTYKPTSGVDRTISFVLKDGVAIYGGFAGNETTRQQRDPQDHLTVLTGDLSGNDNNNIVSNEATRAENSLHVITSNGAGSSTILEGFTVTGGNANLNSGTDMARGGGMWLGYGSPTIRNVVLTRNCALELGGGMLLTNSNSTLTDLTFDSNYSAQGGGGLTVYPGSPVITNTKFANNKAAATGGGALNLNGSSPLFTEVIFSGNTAPRQGAGMANYSSHPTISRSLFYNNHVTDQTSASGGGMYNESSNPVIENTTFSKNTAEGAGSGIANEQSNPIITNVTFTNNWDAILNVGFSHPVIKNSIMWGNIYPGTGGVYTIQDYNNSSSTISDSVIQNGFSGGTNIITTDPLLGTLGNYGGFTETIPLQAGSSAIDSGDDANCPANDQRGVTRPQGSHCDMGAYEYKPEPMPQYVKWDANGANNGMSWTDAYTDLQPALAAALSGDEIWVAAGTYKPTSGADRTVSFILQNGVAIYGGFNGTEISRAQRDPVTNLTILSGDIGMVDDNSDNSYHVVTDSGTDSTSLVDGFTIMSGNANGDSNRSIGGGMFNDSGSPSFANVTFSNNNASSDGGGIYVGSNAHPSFTNVIFSGNTAYNGGGMFNGNSARPSLTNVIFSSNTAYNGGGMNNYIASPSLTNVTFSSNTAHYGGGMYEDAGDPLLTNVTFFSNTAAYGGGIANYGGNPLLTNVTIAGNAANYDGGGIFNSWGEPVIKNSILYGNTNGEIFFYFATPVVTYSTVQGGSPGIGNFDADPLIGPLQDNGGFTQTMALSAGSPAINAAYDASCPSTDQRGVIRPQGSHCDMGAYEYTNQAPTNISLSNTRVDENQAIGTTVGTLGTSDPDMGDIFTYSFCGGMDDTSFSITGSTLKTAAIFDYETKSSYSVCINSTDSGSLHTIKTIGISITNLVDTQTFEDVLDSYWAWSYIERLYNAGITGGCGQGNYCPESPVTRAQMAVFLERGIHGSSYNPPALGGGSGFGDVDPIYWAAAWIKQLAADGITGGCGSGNYCPDLPVTRAQMAIFLLRSKYGPSYSPPAVGGSTGFGDVHIDYWAGAWIKQLVAEGITAGCGSGNYCPETPVTRAQMAVFLVRTFNLP